MRSPRRPTFSGRGDDAGDILLRLAEMPVELAGALLKPADIVEQFADFGLDDMGLLAHPRIANQRLNHLPAIISKEGETIMTQGAMGRCTTSLEALAKIGIERFGRHEKQGEILRLAARHVFFRHILDMNA